MLLTLLQLGVALVDHEDRPFDARLQVGAGDDDRNLDDAVHLWIQTGHLAIEPNQVLVVACEGERCGGRFGGGVLGHDPIVSQGHS